MFLIDFDDTLFDTESFKGARREAVLRLGVSLELWNETYNKARINENGHMVYSDKAHAIILSHHGFSYEEIFGLFKKLTDNSQQWLFPDTIDFLNTLKKYQEPLILLSCGFLFFTDLRAIGKYVQNNSVHISAGAVIYKKNKDDIDILIMHRAKTNTYHLPKGTSEFGETIQQTVVREIQEETNVSIVLGEYLDTVDSSFVRDGNIKQKKTHYFLTEYKSGEPRATDGEHDAVQFASLEKALSLLQEKGGHIRLGFENECSVLELAKQRLLKI